MDKNKDVFINGIDNRLDVKGITLTTAAAAINTLKADKDFTLGSNTQILILTTSSVIYGDILLNLNDNEKDPVLWINKAIGTARNNYLEKNQTDSDVVINNSSYLQIKNATVRPLSGGSGYNFKILNVFTDQILGFSFGELNDD